MKNRKITERAGGAISSRSPESLLRLWIGAIVAFVLAITPILVGPQTAQAADIGVPGIASATLLVNGKVPTDGVDVTAGSEASLQVQYDNNAAGTTVHFKFGPSVELQPVNIPPGNKNITKIDVNGDDLAITFADAAHWDGTGQQELFGLGLKVVGRPGGSGTVPITWQIGPVENKVNVTVINDGDKRTDVTSESANKTDSYGPNGKGDLSQYIKVDNGKVTLDPDIANQDIAYTLVYQNPAAGIYNISDTLPDEMSYVADSFSGKITSWDANGLNQKVADLPAPTINGKGFSQSVTFTGPSKVKIDYKARINPDAVAGLQAKLQAAYDKAKDTPGAPFSTVLTNTALLNTIKKTADVNIKGNVYAPPAKPGPNLNAAFNKSADWSTKNITVDEDGNLTPPADITYTLTSDLTKLKGDSDFAFPVNVVIHDALPEQLSWNTSAADFVTADGITLAKSADGCPAQTADFATDANVGKYCVTGQHFMANIGKDPKTTAVIKAKAKINKITGLPAGTTSITDAKAYVATNGAGWYYTDDANAPGAYKTASVNVVVLPSGDNGYQDTSVFSKTGHFDQVSVDQGQSAKVSYNFKVNAGKGVDVTKSYIVDNVDQTIFDLGDLSTLNPRGDYNGSGMTADDFALSKDADGNLIIKLSDAGKDFVAANGGIDKTFNVKIDLTTKPFDGKVTKEITNKATLFGSDDKPIYWDQTPLTEVTSYGDGAEVRKRVYDQNSSGLSKWVDTLKAKLDASGTKLVQDTYVYRIEFIPHGRYDNIPIVTVVDKLPDATQFLGFVNEADAATAANPTNGPQEMGGNLEAVYDSAAKTVKLQQKDGTLLDKSKVLAPGQPIAAYVAVKVTDAKSPITNVIGSTEAKIVPTGTVSVGDYVWLDSNIDGLQGEDEHGIANVWLNVFGPDGNQAKDIYGNPVAATKTDEHGKYTFDDLPVLSGKQTYTVKIDQDKSADALKGYVPTQAGVGTDRSADSSTWEAPTVPGDLQQNAQRDPTLDFGFTTPSGKFSVTKKLAGDGASLVSKDVKFSGTYSYDAGDSFPAGNGTWSTSAGATWTSAAIPAGAKVTVSEDKPADVAGATWAETPADKTVTVEKDDTAKVTVTNTITKNPGKFSVTKQLTGDGESLVSKDATFSGTWSYPAGDSFPAGSGEWSVKAGATWTSGSIPAGAVVTVHEDKPADVAGASWAATPADQTVTVKADDTADVKVTNTISKNVGKFSVTKKLAGDGASLVSKDAVFSGTYSYDAGVSFPAGNGTWSTTAGKTWTSSAIPAGAVVTVHEDAPADVAGASWAATPDDQTVTVETSKTAKVTVTNTISKNVGKFSVTKKLAGDGASLVSKDATFSGTYSYPAGDTFAKGSGEWSVKAGATWTSGSIPAGAVVTVHEDAPADVAGASWAATPADQTVTVKANETADVKVTNTISKNVGLFSVTKKLAGDAASVPADTTFSGTWSYPDGATFKGDKGEWSVKAGATWTSSAIPAGAKVTVHEDAPAGVAGATWAKTPADQTVTVETGKTADVKVTNTIKRNAVSVGDYVWWDSNLNGIQDKGEPGIPDVVLTISRTDGQPVKASDGGDYVTTTKTDKDGKYWFGNLQSLPKGTQYVVTVTPPAGAAATKANVGDSKTDSSTGSATSTDLPNDGDSDPTLDFGFVPKVSVGDFVWWDSNSNGIQDAGEPGIPDVVLTLVGPDGKPVTDVNGQPVAPTKTDADGKYAFVDLPVLPAGQHYTVKVTDPKGATATKANAGKDSAKDSSTGSAESVDLTANGANDPTLDFGYVPSVSVGDKVWWDNNGDGIQGEGEPGIPDVTLTLVGPDGKPVTDIHGNPVAPTKTDKDGNYLFKDLPTLPAGKHYTVKVTDPKGATPTKANAGDDRAKDSSTGSAESGDLPNNGDSDLTLDFGYVPSVSVGDYVWWDSNLDGIQDSNESGIPDVMLTLTGPDGKPVTDVNGQPVAPTKTDADGKYAFVDLPVLPAGQHYTVTVTPPAGVAATKANAGKDSAKDSSTGSAESVDLTVNGANDPTLDFGFVPKVSVGDFVWWDNNGDGIQGEGEPGIPDVVLTLVGPDGKPVTDVNGKPVAPTKTDKDGNYLFKDLPTLPTGQHYTVKVTNPKGSVPTKANAGDDRAKDSSTGSAESVDLTANGANDLTLDFGFVPKVSVGDFVWADSNRDGRQDKGELGIPGVVLNLVGPDGKSVTDVFGRPVAAVTTDKDGKYSFENLPVLSGDQTYTVTIDQQASADALKSYVPTKAGVGDREGDSSTWQISTQPGDLQQDAQRDPTLDFGFVTKTYALGDVVWIDANGNGVQDANEKPLAGVTVDLLQGGKVVGSTTTDKDGRYVFDELSAGTYQVRFTLTDAQKKIYGFTKQDQGANDAADSDASVKDGLTATITLDDSNAALTGDYAFRAIKATQGIDPTWDAGVVLLPVPAPVVPKTPAVPTTPKGKPVVKPNVLSNTGSSVRGVAVGALVLMVLGGAAGIGVVLRKRQNNIG